MLHEIIFNGNEMVCELLKSMGFQMEEKEVTIDNIPIVNDIKNRIKELESIENRARIERQMLSQFLACITGASQKHKKPETAKSPEEVSETKTAEPPPEKIDAEPSPCPVNPQLKILEREIQRAIRILKKAPMLKRFKKLKRLNRLLVSSIKTEQGLTECERIVGMEAAIGEALSFLQTAKIAARSKVLKELRKILEDAVNRSREV